MKLSRSGLVKGVQREPSRADQNSGHQAEARISNRSILAWNTQDIVFVTPVRGYRRFAIVGPSGRQDGL